MFKDVECTKETLIMVYDVGFTKNDNDQHSVNFISFTHILHTGLGF